MRTGAPRKQVHISMDEQPTNIHLLQNNNAPQRQQNQLRPGGSGRPNGNGQTPQRGPSLVNRWLLIIVGVMLAIYVYMWFNMNTNSASSPQRNELSYSAFYDQINAGNIKTPHLSEQPISRVIFSTP